jgi:hypothetical protein
MNNEEAIVLLEQELAGFRDESYDKLLSRISAGSLDFERVGPSGAKYQVEIQVLWDGRRGGNIRVMGSIDDGGLRAFIPLNRDFIKAPDGSFVGE